ncbi:MAG: outer membrane lipoprotein chaperone LolA [Oleispira antarctica]|nr:outer membrane lipoprotein chaperone LolA [Oleispira antarctica]MBQ0792548.1 outer membrane lipoprotein chaperone LolA [Oleispira antarctica]
MKRTLIMGFSLACGLSLSALALASEVIQVSSQPVANTTHAVENLQKQLGLINSFSANFVQLTQDGLGNTLQRVEGFMQVEKPGKLRWKTEGIYEQLVISDGKSLWIYDADLEQVSIKDMDNRLSETPALLLGGDVSAIGDDFIITQAPGENAIRFILQPKDTSQLFDSLELDFNKLDEQQSLTQMIIRDASGQVTNIRFTNVLNNPKLNQDLFNFNIPKGIDVIDGRQGKY